MLLVKQFREERDVSQIAAANVIKEIHPGMDKHLLSKVENPDKYGIRLTNSAERALEDAFPTTVIKARRADRHRNKKKVQCRMSERLYERLQRALNKAGYNTMQDGLEFIINSWLESLTHEVKCAPVEMSEAQADLYRQLRNERAGQGSNLDTGCNK